MKRLLFGLLATIGLLTLTDMVSAAAPGFAGSGIGSGYAELVAPFMLVQQRHSGGGGGGGARGYVGGGGGGGSPRGYVGGSRYAGGYRGTRYFWGGVPFYFYDGYYHGDCGWLRRRARETGSEYWWRRYRQCRDD